MARKERNQRESQGGKRDADAIKADGKQVRAKDSNPKDPKLSKRKRSGYRKATYPSAVRMARLVDEMPRHGLGRRLSSVAESLSVSDQTVKRYVKALNEEFVTEQDDPQFVIEKQGGEEWLVRRSKYDDKSQANIYQLISVYLSLEIFKMLGVNNLFVDLVDDVLREVEQKLTSKETH